MANKKRKSRENASHVCIRNHLKVNDDYNMDNSIFQKTMAYGRELVDARPEASSWKNTHRHTSNWLKEIFSFFFSIGLEMFMVFYPRCYYFGITKRKRSGRLILPSPWIDPQTQASTFFVITFTYTSMMKTEFTS